MKCFNTKCQQWMETGCFLAFENSCKSIIPKSEPTATAPVESQSTGSVCLWEFDPNECTTEELDYVTDCGMRVELVYKLEIAGFKFCPCCGKPIKQNV